MIADMETISYLRRGRKLRATGAVIEKDSATRMTKVKPLREDWGAIWLDQSEIDAGREKPPIRPREKRDDAEPKPKPRKAKSEALPKWKQLVGDVREYEREYTPESWCPINLGTVSALADELESAHAKLAEFLPLNVTTHTPGANEKPLK